jgi:branched-chain amino acid transport system permease protein
MDTSRTVEILVVAYLGGRGSLWGPAVAAFPIVFVTEWLRASLTEFPGLHLVIYGVVLILVMIFYPGGLAQLVRTVGERRQVLLGSARRLARASRLANRR